ncbi:uncharacterized protein MONBRDRAFT_12436 [Monosiga brevicollis MX1]|uniref:AAA+ ATPase domain-containing protein n=1 Tax=Monosiga brevicollis TaxID=81824 RepID=A9VC96_MONBE|nr:uncharacterized protein MONBRDRAFT_12436 [Monosiga brevicollis MX1]EDQ84822.1 predicted protein [Monosiga brevicollis MX1]|eukprot:XP_001750323.1 hypothetical protein [Monosiga brevicollis MX1]
MWSSSSSHRPCYQKNDLPTSLQRLVGRPIDPLAYELLEAKSQEHDMIYRLLDELVSQASRRSRTAGHVPESWRVKDDTSPEEYLELCQNLLVRETAEEFCALGNLAKEPDFDIAFNRRDEDDITQGLLIHRVCPKGASLNADALRQQLSTFRSTLFVWEGRLCFAKQPYVNCPCRKESERNGTCASELKHENSLNDIVDIVERLRTNEKSQHESADATHADNDPDGADADQASRSSDTPNAVTQSADVAQVPSDDPSAAAVATDSLKCLLHPNATLQVPCCVGPSVEAFAAPSVMKLPSSRIRQLNSLATMLTTVALLGTALDYLARQDKRAADLEHWLEVFCRPQRRRPCLQLQPQPRATAKDPSQDEHKKVVKKFQHELEVVQGPPGTGKSTLLSRAVAHCAESAFSEDGDNFLPHAILIVAVQNKACENILQRLDSENVSMNQVLVLGTERHADRLGPWQRCALMQNHQERDPDVQAWYAAFNNASNSEAREKLHDRLQLALRKAELSLCATAKIVVATLDSVQLLLTSRRLMLLRDRIKCIFCDEAGTLPEFRVPIFSFFDTKFVLLIGDTKQLPPFTRLPYETARGPLSPMARMQKCLGQAGVHKLTQQYRSHPVISNFVSKLFYEGSLHTHESVHSRKCKPGLEYFEGLRYEYTHQDDDHQEQTVEELVAISQPNWIECLCKESMMDVARTSYVNLKEALAVQEQLEKILHRVATAQQLASGPSTPEEASEASASGEASVMPCVTVDVITFYKAQVRVLEQRLLFLGIIAKGVQYNVRIEVKTVDAAQGSEADVVILSPVRCHALTDDKTLGFLQDVRRLNVACSRARSALIVVGCLSYSHGPDATRVWDLYSYFRDVAGNFTTIPQFFRQRGYYTVGMGKIFHPGHASGQNSTHCTDCSGGDDLSNSWDTYFHAPNTDYPLARCVQEHNRQVLLMACATHSMHRISRTRGDGAHAWYDVSKEEEEEYPLPDTQMGRVITALSDLGLADDTVISFWGDHGWQLGDAGMYCKHTNFEPATRAPMLVHAPGLTDNGIMSTHYTEHIDSNEWAELDSTPTASICLSRACVMGYTVVTHVEGSEYRYTEWVEFNNEDNPKRMDWSRNFGTELYNMTALGAEPNVNIAGYNSSAAVVGVLQPLLHRGPEPSGWNPWQDE